MILFLLGALILFLLGALILFLLGALILFLLGAFNTLARILKEHQSLWLRFWLLRRTEDIIKIVS
ncbi:hypothetical protein BGV40_07960 [Methanosarcina sp. Ant1]|nr:hypothetical protein BGV40_07960 [Methanosarcina sp. Ant1]